MSNKLIPIRTNRIWLKMVFRNLLKNAVKYGDKEGMIALGFEDQGSSYRLNVYNSGKPIPEEYREKLFTKFMGNGNGGNGKEIAGGTGLGLYLIKKVIEKLGGEIRYEAKENGSNFIFTLPSRSTFVMDSPLPIGAPLQLAILNK
jgi:two-component system sensor kinase